MLKLKTNLIILGSIITLSLAPVSEALADGHGYGHGHGFHGGGPIGAIVGLAAAIVAVPFIIAGSAIEAVTPAPYYSQPPVAYYPPNAYSTNYSAPAVTYYQPQQGYYAPPPPPSYYARPAANYGVPPDYYPQNQYPQN